LIPIAWAVSRSWAVARIAFPHVVRVTKNWSPSIRGMAAPTTSRSLVVRKILEFQPSHS
jgi:hypothetical protein